jgi:TolB protein
MRRIARLILGSTLAACAASAGAQDTTSRGVRIGLTYNPGVKPGVMVLPATWLTGDSVRAIIQRDLDYSDRVTVIMTPSGDSAGMPGRGALNYPLFARLGAAALVQLAPTSSGIRATVHDVAKTRVLEQADFRLPLSSTTAEWRLAVHGVTDEIERWITGVRGIASTRVLYVRDKQIRIVDSDGANDRVLAGGGTACSFTCTSPAWHPNGRVAAYTVMTESGTRLAVRDLDNNSVRWASSTPYSIAITPAFSRDGSLLAYAYGTENGTDIFVAPALAAGQPRRVTVGRGSENINPTFSPDGRKISFVSGRLGHPEVYITDADGTNVELLTQANVGEQAYRTSPDWSPDGRTIAYHAQIGGVFQIFTIGLRERVPRQLTSDASNEDPWWAPDSRHVVFTSTRSGVPQLYVMDVESGRVRQLTHGGGSRLGSWSPHLGSSPPTE